MTQQQLGLAMALLLWLPELPQLQQWLQLLRLVRVREGVGWA
jgi:hypothetical protein